MSRTKSTKKKRTKKKKTKTGTAFEVRAKVAFEFIRPDRETRHDEHVDAIYGRPRQLDVTERANGRLERAHEAKDYAGRVPIEKVDAFETKLRELTTPPSHSCAIVSANGFQAGPIARAKHYREHPHPSVRVLDLFQLREVDPVDFEGRIREIQLEFQARGVCPETVRLRTVPSDGPSEERTFHAERQQSFVYDETGQIVDNILDRVNQLVTEHRGDEPVERLVEFDRRVFCQLDGQKIEITGVDLRLAPNITASRVAMDIGSGARDVLIDCVGDERWIIPDPDKALSASRDGHALRISFDDSSIANMTPLAVPEDLEEKSPNARLVNAIQLQIALGLLKANREGQEAPPGLIDGLKRATEAFTQGRLAEARELYWKTCSEIASSLPALVNLTHIHLEEGDLDGALHLAGRTVELFPFEEHGFVNYVVVSLRRNELERARDGLDASMLLHAGHPALIRVEAELLFAEGKPIEAAQRFMELYYRGIDPAENRYLAARCEARAGRVEEALWDVERARERSELPAEAEVFLVKLLEKSQQYERLREIGLQILGDDRLGSEDRDLVRVSVAGAAYELGDPQASAALLAKAQTSTPGHHFVSGLVALSQNDFASAIREFEASEISVPNITAARWNLALCHFDRGDAEKALSVLDRCEIDDAPSALEFWRFRSVVHAARGDEALAMKAGEAAIDAGADAPAHWIEASDAALLGNHWAVWFQLRPRCLEHESDVPSVKLEQAFLMLDQVGRVDAATTAVRARLDAARATLGSSPRFVVAELLFLIRTRDASLDARWASARTSSLQNEALALLATEAQARGRFEMALEMVDSTDRESPSTDSPFKAPPIPAIRAAACFGLGRSDDARLALDQLSAAERLHTFAKLMMAYREFADGNLDATAGLLDEILLQAPDDRETIHLQLAAWLEQGRYGDAYALIRRLAPGTAVAESAEWWSNGGARAPTGVVLPDGIQSMAGDAPYMVLIGHVAIATYYWVVGFDSARKFAQEKSLPTLVRLQEPTKTIQLLREMVTRGHP